MIATVIGFVLGVVFVGVVGYFSAPSVMMIEEESALGYEETVQAIQDAAVEQGWAVPTVHELHMSVGKYGYDVLPVSVIELCQPHHAAKILAKDDARIVTSMMPCRVSVYETSDGKVIVSRMNTGLVSKLFGGTVSEVMADATKETDVILAAALD